MTRDQRKEKMTSKERRDLEVDRKSAKWSEGSPHYSITCTEHTPVVHAEGPSS